jgi:hypothetical protein
MNSHKGVVAFAKRKVTTWLEGDGLFGSDSAELRVESVGFSMCKAVVSNISCLETWVVDGTRSQ